MIKSLHAFKVYQKDLKVSCPRKKITGTQLDLHDLSDVMNLSLRGK